MYKMKVKKAAKKRFSVNKKGLIRKSCSNKRHLLTKRAKNRKRALSKIVALDSANSKNVRKCLLL